jgi:hypothetical protein
MIKMMYLLLNDMFKIVSFAEHDNGDRQEVIRDGASFRLSTLQPTNKV